MRRHMIGASVLAFLLPLSALAQDNRPPPRGEEAHPPPAHAPGARPPQNASARPPQNGGYRPGAGAAAPVGGQRAPEVSGFRPGGGAPAAMAQRPGGYGAGPSGARAGGSFAYMGRSHPRYQGGPFRYPPGYGYRRWVLGQSLPLLFLSPYYFFNDYAALGLDPPPFGYQWVRYGPDLLLVQIGTGRIVDVVYGAIY